MNTPAPAPADFPAPARRRAPFALIVRPIRAFFELQAAGGIVLLFCTVAALWWANFAHAHSYSALWQTKLTVGTESFGLSKPLILWINDGLMAIFFFVVGLEIKREVLVGELSSPRGAALPLIAAAGGMVVPALIYAGITLAAGTAEARRGWAIPCATDIAFALGVLALLGRRAPAGLRVFLTALAIADDLGAVLVIAIFYTSQLSLAALGVAAAFFAAMLIVNRLNVRAVLVYAALGLGMWVAVLKSGVHPTIAGVLAALAIPARRRIDEAAFLARGRELLDRFAAGVNPGEDDPSPTQRRVVHELESTCQAVTQPLHRIEHALHPWVAFAIMPVFALANAGVALQGGGVGDAAKSPVALGVFLGLLVGKPLGVYAFALAAVRLGWAKLPGDSTWRQLLGVACLCGIGFTMSLFIASLAFATPAVLDTAKLGILVGSALSALLGAGILLTSARQVTTPGSERQATPRIDA